MGYSHVVCFKEQSSTYVDLLTGYINRDHPFKTSSFFRGIEVYPLPTIADSRRVGVSGMPTSEYVLLNHCIEYYFVFVICSIRTLFFILNEVGEGKIG